MIPGASPNERSPELPPGYLDSCLDPRLRGSVPGRVHQGVLGDPRHHGAQALADFLDLVLGTPPAGGLEGRRADGVFGQEVANEAKNGNGLSEFRKDFLWPSTIGGNRRDLTKEAQLKDLFRKPTHENDQGAFANS